MFGFAGFAGGSDQFEIQDDLVQAIADWLLPFISVSSSGFYCKYLKQN